MTTDNDTTETAAGVTRRKLLRDAGLIGGAFVSGGSLGAGRAFAGMTAFAAGAAALSLTPEQEEGPFYVALDKIRKNVTLGRPGVPLTLRLTVVNSTSGRAIPNAACDIWQCDATGVYSDESSESTVGQTWLRGVQVTDGNGLAEFDTVYPGHYAGRATHIHVKVHIGGTRSGTKLTGGHVSHTGQLFFDDAISTRVYALAPYNTETDARVPDNVDRVYTQQGGRKALLRLTALGSAVADGYLGTITLGVDPASTPGAVG